MYNDILAIKWTKPALKGIFSHWILTFSVVRRWFPMVSTRNQAKQRPTQDTVMARKKDATKEEEKHADKQTKGNSALKSEDHVCSHEHEHEQGQEHGPLKETGVKSYLRGFGKRVIICSILVVVFRSLWPRVQPYVWPEAPGKEGKLYVLTDRSFRGHVSRGDHFVMMYAPWCGHCQQMKPAWEKLAKSPGVAGLKVSKVDCTAHETVCKTHQVHGYPTLLYFRNGVNIGKHDGDKSLDGLKKFVNKMKPKSQDEKTKAEKTKTKKSKKSEL